MATNGKLSAYGELYEGNFDEWKTRLKARVSYRTGIHDVDLPNDFEYLYTKGITSQDVATHICFLTSPAMLERVPLDLRSDYEELFRALEVLAKPFRLIELPAEIRNMIYEKAMPERHWVVDTSDDVEKDPRVHVGFPSLLHTNMQIRQESLSIFYSTVIFCMDFKRTNREVFLKGSAIVESWSIALVKLNLKHLHCIRLWTTPDSVVDIQYSEDKGLTYDLDYGDVPDDCALLVKEHMQALESTRKVLGLKGEAIVIALLSNWSLWWTVYEKLKD